MTQARRFRTCLDILVCIKVFYWFWYYPLLFGAEAITYSAGSWGGGLKDLFYILYLSDSSFLPAVFLGLCLLCIVSGEFFRGLRFFSDLVLWFLIVNLHHKVYQTLTGGDFLLNQFLFFQVFLSGGTSRKALLQDLQTFAHNLAGVGLILQICYVYFFSALAKISDSSWLEGSAIGQIALIDQFSMYRMFRPATTSPVLYVLINYLVLLYQFIFPFALIRKDFKKIFLLAGILMHLYISFVMGLFLFGLVMITGYVFLWPAVRRNSPK